MIILKELNIPLNAQGFNPDAIERQQSNTDIKQVNVAT